MYLVVGYYLWIIGIYAHTLTRWRVCSVYKKRAIAATPAQPKIDALIIEAPLGVIVETGGVIAPAVADSEPAPAAKEVEAAPKADPVPEFAEPEPELDPLPNPDDDPAPDVLVLFDPAGVAVATTEAPIADIS